jgi:hypothetical protein
MKTKNPEYRYYIRPHSFEAKRKVLLRYSGPERTFEFFSPNANRFHESFSVTAWGSAYKALRKNLRLPDFKPISVRRARAQFPEAFS